MTREQAYKLFTNELRQNGCHGLARDIESGRDNSFAGTAAIDAIMKAGADPLNELARRCYAAAYVWHHDLVTGEPIERNKGEMIALMHSELSEMLEGERKNLMDSHLPHRKSAEVELADLLIRAFDYAGKFGFDLDGAVAEKMTYNAQRADHKPAARLAEGGKAF